MKNEVKKRVVPLFIGFVLLVCGRGLAVENQIITVSPDWGYQGDAGLELTITLDTDNPPAPPGGTMPDSVSVGSISGYSVSHSSQYTVTAVIDIPSDEATGVKDVSVVFTTPQGELIFTISGGFSVLEDDGTSGTAGEPYDGYNLFSPMTSKQTYLMDNDGNFLKTWTSSYNPGLSVYLLEDGTLLRTANTGGTNFNAGGAGGRVEKYSWDGDLLWSYDHSSADYRLHHDIEMLPNGNILMIAWEYKTEAQIIAAGGDITRHTAGELWPDYIIEVEPDGANGGNIVWQWHVWDHLIQDYDPTKPNYAVVSEHPEKINLNYTLSGNSDWNHINSIDYNPQLDQILLSVRNFSEIWIIDHSVTTQEAAGSAGDLLYRWGNPQTYDMGDSSDQKLFVQHDAEWIETGLDGEGDILIFNNGQGRAGGNYSSIDQITAPLVEDGTYTRQSGLAYGPDDPTWTYSASPVSDFYSMNISGSQRLGNGDTLICEGAAGRLFEVASDGTIVWEYDHDGEIFRVERYAPDYAGFVGTELEPEPLAELKYRIVDTAQAICYDDTTAISSPSAGGDYYGQDAQFDGNQPSYTISNDGLTVTDNVTLLVWTKTADITGDGVIDESDKLLYSEALAYPDVLNAANYGGYDDWRLPTIKELYSLMNFTGEDPSSFTGTDTSGLVPFIDTNYFDFAYGDTSAGERIIDAQWASSTLYVSTTMGGNETMFGLNLADGRIKGYPTTKLFYVYFVRGNSDYGINNFVDNGDATVSDKATGLMWSQDDSGAVDGNGPRSGLNWQQALAWVQAKNAANYLGYNDWRLPNAKELQSIVDYSRSPDTSGSAAIDPVFNTTQIINEAGEADYPWFWTGTTHSRMGGGGSEGAYVCFGRAIGYWQNTWQDVHGAGCQRSDLKSGDLDALSGYTYVSDGYYLDMAPQGDSTRINNYVRLVRDTGCGEPGFVSGLGGDINDDCFVDMLDFAFVSGQWLSSYDLTDLNLIAQNWLSSL